MKCWEVLRGYTVLWPISGSRFQCVGGSRNGAGDEGYSPI